MKSIRILAVEDDGDYRELIRNTLRTQPDMQLISLCAHGAEALAVAVRTQPDIVLMDLNLDTVEMDGADVARKIRLQTDARVIILTAFDDPDLMVNACRRGFACGYVLKSQASLLIPTIRAIAGGTTPQSMLICSSLLEPLTNAERAVYELLMGRKVELHSAEKTIANQKTSVLRKLGVSSKEELVHVFSVYYPDRR